MGHSRTRIFEQHYQSLNVAHDVQNAFIGIPSETSLLHISSRMLRALDPRLPQERDITTTDRRQLFEKSEELDELNKRFLQLQEDFKQLKMKEPEQPHEQTLHDESVAKRKREVCLLGKQRECLKKRLVRTETDRRRVAHLETAPLLDIQRQLDGLPATISAREEAPNIVHEQRVRVAETLFTRDVPQQDSEEDIERRVRALDDLIALCPMKEPFPRTNKTIPQDFNGPSDKNPTMPKPALDLANTADLDSDWSPNLVGNNCADLERTNCFSDLLENDDLGDLNGADCFSGPGGADTPDESDSFSDLIDFDACSEPLACAKSDGAQLKAIEHKNLVVDFAATSACAQKRNASGLEATLNLKVSPKPPVASAILTRSGPVVLGPHECLHCRFDQTLGEARFEESKFYNKASMQRHFRNKHRPELIEKVAIPCPDDWCNRETFHGLSHMKNHVFRLHGVDYGLEKEPKSPRRSSRCEQRRIKNWSGTKTLVQQVIST